MFHEVEHAPAVRPAVEVAGAEREPPVAVHL